MDTVKNLIDPVMAPILLLLSAMLFSWRDKKRPARLLLLFAFLALYLPSIPMVSNNLCYLLEKKYLMVDNKAAEKPDIVVVLGGGVFNNRLTGVTLPSNQTSARLLTAVQAFRESGAKLLVCAGKGKGETTEAEVMCGAARRLGVPAEKLLTDRLSENTSGHVRELNKLFPDKDVRIGLVTSAYHMKRSEMEFRKSYRSVIPMPADFLYKRPEFSFGSFIPSTGNLYKSSVAMQELVKIAWYGIKG